MTNKVEMRAALSAKFGGDLNAAKYLQMRVGEISQVIEKIGMEILPLLSKEEYKKIMITFSKAYADMYTEIVLPALYKFPELDGEKSKE